MKLGAVLLTACLVCGCATIPAKPRGPSGRCMKSADKLPAPKVGESLVDKYGELQSQYTDMAQRNDCLQRYVQAVTK